MTDRPKEAYRIERTLARRLRAATKEERPRVAQQVYGELYRRVHWHSDLNRTPRERLQRALGIAFSYERWIPSSGTVLELGAGSCDSLRYLADRHAAVTFLGIDVTREPFAAGGSHLCPNLHFLQAGAAGIPLGTATVDFAFCSQVLEHFHPDDVRSHIAEISRVLKAGGWLGIDTPNRLTGPHDISRGFTKEATGLHLKEWTLGELVTILESEGFEQIFSRLLPGRIARGLRFRPPGPLLPALYKTALEKWVSRIRHAKPRRAIARACGLNGIYLYARKRTSESQ